MRAARGTSSEMIWHPSQLTLRASEVRISDSKAFSSPCMVTGVPFTVALSWRGCKCSASGSIITSTGSLLVTQSQLIKCAVVEQSLVAPANIIDGAVGSPKKILMITMMITHHFPSMAS